MSKLKRIVNKIVFNKVTYNLYKPFSLLFKSSKNIDNPLDVLHSYYSDNGTSALVKRGISEERKYNLAIIIPCYNCEKYIDDCLNSIINQNDLKYTFQIIVVDDGSSDNTISKLEKWKNKISDFTIISQQNKGAGAARNAGIKVAKSDYIMFLDSDDVLDKKAINTLLTKAYNEQCDVVQADFLYFFNDNLLDNKKPKDNAHLNGLLGGKAFKSTLFSNIHFPENYWFEDTNNVFLVFKEAQKKVIIKDVVFYYRQHKNNISKQDLKNPRRLETIYVTLRMIEDYRQKYKTSDQYLLDTFLGQIYINYCRTKHLDKKCKRAIFDIYFEIYKSMEIKSPSNKKYTDLVKALDTRNYNLYLLYLRSI